MNPTLTWRPTWPDIPHTHDTEGTATWGGVKVGTAWFDGTCSPTCWRWSLYVTGCSVDRTRFETEGEALERDDAKAAVETAWLAFLALADPGRLHELRWRAADGLSVA